MKPTLFGSSALRLFGFHFTRTQTIVLKNEITLKLVSGALHSPTILGGRKMFEIIFFFTLLIVSRTIVLHGSLLSQVH